MSNQVQRMSDLKSTTPQMFPELLKVMLNASLASKCVAPQNIKRHECF
jgi:hypothetical protein